MPSAQPPSFFTLTCLSPARRRALEIAALTLEAGAKARCNRWCVSPTFSSTINRSEFYSITMDILDRFYEPLLRDILRTIKECLEADGKAMDDLAMDEIRECGQRCLRDGWGEMIRGHVLIPMWQAGANDEALQKLGDELRSAIGMVHNREFVAQLQVMRDLQSGQTPVNDESYLAPRKLAELFRVPVNLLRPRLNRWRKNNHNGWIENSERGGQEAQYLYRVGSVRHIIEKTR